MTDTQEPISGLSEPTLQGLREQLDRMTAAAARAEAARDTITAERDELKGHLERVTGIAERAEAARNTIAEEREALRRHLARETELVAEAEASRDAMVTERDALQQHLDQQTKSATQATVDRDAMTAERDVLEHHLANQTKLADQATGAREAMMAERDALQRHLEDRAHIAEEAEVARVAMEAERDDLKRHVEYLSNRMDDLTSASGAHPPGHFYSPIPALDEIEADAPRIWKHQQEMRAGGMTDLPGLDIRAAGQLDLLHTLAEYLQTATAGHGSGRRYRAENDAFGPVDAAILEAMLRHIRPKRIIEVGAGFSSAVMLDTRDEHLNGAGEFTFVEPYPDLLYELLKPDDLAGIEVIDKRIQDVPITLFEQLGAGDLLFIDSTHVSKVGSDVNTLVFDIVPRVKPGVIVHFHDIPYPFEYPRKWVSGGRFWNEAYLLRALLTHSQAFEILLFTSFIQQHLRAEVEELVPGHRLNPGGSLYLRRT